MAADILSSQARTRLPAASQTAYPEERRKRVRTSVHWRVTLFRASPRSIIETATKDLSSDGFYCITNSTMTVGESVIVLLQAPAHDPRGADQTYLFRCKGRVVRVEPDGVDGCFGVACHIDDYVLWRSGDREAAIAEISAAEHSS
jgi:hypothetical protein